MIGIIFIEHSGKALWCREKGTALRPDIPGSHSVWATSKLGITACVCYLSPFTSLSPGAPSLKQGP